MMRAALVATLLFACADRSLDHGEVADAGQDLAGVDLRPSLGTSAVGVPCGSSTCVGGEACCASPSNATCKHVSTFLGACGAGTRTYRCDGPEDCMPGQECIDFGSGQGFETMCVNPLAVGGNRGGLVVICHSASDCASAMSCTPETMNPTEAPQLSRCQ
jgi:hypothetical protein